MKRRPSRPNPAIVPFVSLATCITLIVPLHARPNRASPAGPDDLVVVVRDASGAVVPSAIVVIRQDTSGLERVVRAREDGTLSLSRTDGARLILKVLAPGFAPAVTAIEGATSGPLVVTLTPAPIVDNVTVVSASRQEELRATLNTRVDVITRSRIEETGGHEIDYLTLRDDAPARVRDRAAAALREVVARHTAAGRRVLVLPLLIAYGGIERGIHDRLQGLSYTMSSAGLMPDDRLAAWVLEMAHR